MPLPTTIARLDYATGVTPLDRARSLRGTGVHTLLVHWPNNQPYCYGWDGRDGYDYKPMELLLNSLLREDADARFVLSFGALHGTPYYWGVDHYDQLAVFNMNRAMQSPSLGSTRWRHDSTDAARRYARHFASSEFAEKIVGFYAFNTAVEWHGVGEVAANVPAHEVPKGYEFALEGDISEPMKQAFRTYLAGRYGSDKVLQEAWRQVDVTLAEALLPTRVEVRSPTPNVRDYFRCYNRLNTALAESWCDALHEGGGGRPVGLSHGYAFGWPQQSEPPQGSGHAEPEPLLASKSVAYFVSPPTTRPEVRCPLSSHPIASLRHRGKHHVHVIESPSLFDLDPAQQLNLLALGFGYAAANGSHVALGELRSGPGSLVDTRERLGRIPYDDDAVRAGVEKLRRWHEAARQAESVGEVAVFISPTAVYGRGIDPLHGRRHVAEFRENTLGCVGVPFDEYYLFDFDAVAERYKAWVLLDIGDASETVWQKLSTAGSRAIQPAAQTLSAAELRERLSAAEVTAWSATDDFVTGNAATVTFAAHTDGGKSLDLPDSALIDAVSGDRLLPTNGRFLFEMAAGAVRVFDRVS